MTRLAFAAIVAALPTVVDANPRCGTYEHITEELSRRYSETIQARMVNPGQITEVWANPETETWTVVTIMATGLTCIRAGGVGVEWFPHVQEERT